LRPARASPAHKFIPVARHKIAQPRARQPSGQRPAKLTAAFVRIDTHRFPLQYAPNPAKTLAFPLANPRLRMSM